MQSILFKSRCRPAQRSRTPNLFLRKGRPQLEIIFEDWGLIEYQRALDKQLEYIEKVSTNPNHPDYLIFCTHPAVVTIGRQTQDGDVFSFDGPVIEVSRGGRATYHGPSQLVVYPMMNLKIPRKNRKPQEVQGFIRSLEEAIVKTLADYGIAAKGKTASTGKSDLQDTGVWVQEKKIASIGIAVRKWISFHGAAINVLQDVTAFQGLKPCGYEGSVMTSLQEVINSPIDIAEFKSRLRNHCFREL